MRKVGSGGWKIPKEHLRIIRYAIPNSPMWALSCVNGWLYTKVGQENVGSLTVRHVEVCSPKGERATTISVLTPAAK